MTLTLELTPEQEQQLEAEARRRNMDAAGYARARLFDEATQEPATRAPRLSRRETELRETISFRRPSAQQARFDFLVTRRRAEKITEEELAELLTMTDQSERQGAERVRAIIELAQLKRVSLDEMLRQLEI